MNLRKKVLLFFIYFIIMWFIIMQFIIPFFIMKSFNAIEIHSFEEKMIRVERGLERFLTKHQSPLLDWTKWTYAYDYVEGGDNDFIEQNITDSFFIDQKINYIIIFDKNNNVAASFGFDHELNIWRKVPKDLSETIKAYDNLDGLLHLNNKAYVFSKYNVSDTNSLRTSRGSMSFISELEFEEIGKLAEDLQENLFILSLYEEGAIDGISKEFFENDINSHVIYKLPYTNKDAYLKLKLALPNTISSIGRDALREGTIIFTISSIILCTFTYILIKKLVDRILKLNKDVIKIRQNNDIGIRVDSSGNDEMRTLQDNINRMLDHIDSMNQELNEHATYDMMTGALNRRYGFDKLDNLMSKARETDLIISIAFVDINNLKYVNDSYGHGEGDSYIRMVSKTIRDNINKTDLFIRLGGDEFLIVFINSDYKATSNMMSKIKSCLLNMEDDVESKYKTSISYGVVEYDKLSNITHFIELADIEMYKDKRSYKSLL